MTRRVILLATVHVALAAGLTGLAGNDPLTAVDVHRVIGLTIAFAVVGLLPVHVELGRHATSVTLVDAALVVGFFTVHDPRAIALAALGGEVVACAVSRQQLLKVVFNAAAALGTVTLSARTFALLDEPDATQPLTWVVTLAAVVVYALSNHASTSAVLMVVEGRRFHHLFREAFVPAAAATAVSAGLGLTVVVLFAAAPGAPALLIPLGAVAYAAFRAVAAQRAESLRFKRLYEASARTASLHDVAMTLTAVADEARALVGGTVAVAAAPDAAGRWYGVVVSDGEAQTLPADATEAVRVLAGHGDREHHVSDVDVTVGQLAPGARDVVVASAAGEVAAVLAVFRDITDERSEARSEVLAAFAGHAALAAANARLFDEVEESLQRQIDLHRQKDQFLAAVSHELRTPLTSVLGAVGTLRQHNAILKPEKRDLLYEMAERQGIRLKRLIEDLLLVAATESGTAAVYAEPVEIGPFLQRVLAETRHAELAMRIEPDTPRVVVTDQSRLRQVVDALVDNASKFAGGEIELLVRPAPGSGVVFAVQDHGAGIPEADRERVFERFVQLDQSSTRRYGGTGTGLYLCRQLAELLGAVLVAEETPGGGATFALALPEKTAGGSNRAIALNAANVDHGQETAAAAPTITTEELL